MSGPCTGPPPPRPGPGAHGGFGRGQQPAPSLTWQSAEQVDRAEEGARRPELVLEQLEEAREADRPVVLYVATASDERRMQAAAEACQQMEQSLFQNYEVASRLAEHFTLIRVNLEEVDGQALRRYGANPRVAPQLIVFDSQLNRIAQIAANARPVQVARSLDQAKERNDLLLEQRERTQRRNSAR